MNISMLVDIDIRVAGANLPHGPGSGLVPGGRLFFRKVTKILTKRSMATAVSSSGEHKKMFREGRVVILSAKRGETAVLL